MTRRVAVLGLLAAAPCIHGQFDPLPTRQSTVVPDLSLCAYVRLNEGAPLLSMCCRQRGGVDVSPSVCLTDCILDFEESDTTLKWWTCPFSGGAKYTTVDYAWISLTTAPRPVAPPTSTKPAPSTSRSAAATTAPQTSRASPSPSPPPPSTSSLSKPTVGTTSTPAPSSTTTLVEPSTTPSVTTLPSPSSTADVSESTAVSPPELTAAAIESSGTDRPTSTPTATDGQVKGGGSETAGTQSSKTTPRYDSSGVVTIAVVMAIMMALE